MGKHLCWEPQYAFEKIFTLTTRWQLLHLPELTLDERLSMSDLFIPDMIKKIRNIRSIASYEIIWKKEHYAIEMLKEYREVNDDDVNDDDIKNNLLTSIEPQNLVLKCYPELVEIFENARNTKTKKRTANSRKKKTTTTVGENSEIRNVAKPRENKTRKKILENKNNKKIDEYISRDHCISLEDSFEKMAITPKRPKNKSNLRKANEKNMSEYNAVTDINQMKRGPQFRKVLEVEQINSRLNSSIDRMFNKLSPDDFTSENEDNDLDVTNVIENICSKQSFQVNVRNCQRIESSTENFAEEHRIGNKSLTSTNEEHIFLEDEKQKSDDSDDEFGNIRESYVPINQRIQMESNKNLLQMCNQRENRFNFDFENVMDETDNDCTYC